MLSIDWKTKFAPASSGHSPSVNEVNELIEHFDKGEIIFADYLAWVQGQLELPIVNDSFFTTIDPKSIQPLISKYETIKSYWSSLCVPVGEWDGHLIVVGCLFNDLSFDFIDEKNTKVVLLLSNYTQTKKLWKLIRPYVDSKFSHLDEKTQGGFKIDLASLEIPKVTNTETPLIELVDETPSEIQLETDESKKLNQSEIDETIAALMAQGDSGEAPQGLELNVEPPPPPAPLTNHLISPLSSSDNGSIQWSLLEPKWNEIYDEMKTFFDHSLIMQVDKNEEFGVVSYWSPEVKPPSEPGVQFSLKTPSVFRIAYTTQRPYHGYVVTNDINESFFEEWNSHEVPSHITVYPIFDQDQVIALLIGIGNDSSSRKNSLSLTEKMSELISTTIKAQINNKKQTA